MAKKKKKGFMKVSPLVKSITEKHLTSFDGTDICYYVGGEGIPVIIANGLGGSLPAFQKVFEHFEEGYQFITWDYRGLYRSGHPDDTSSLALPCHAEDMAEILRAEEIDKAILVGWSMGVQVILEYCRRWSDTALGVVSICGTPGDPISTQALGGRWTSTLIRRMLQATAQNPAMVQRIMKPLFETPIAARLFKRTGVVGRTTNMIQLRQFMRNFATIDVETFCRIFLYQADHSAADVLQTLSCPLLVLAGEDDDWVPMKVAYRMQEAAPDAELCVVPYGTHFCLFEFADYLNLRMEQFFEKVTPK